MSEKATRKAPSRGRSAVGRRFERSVPDAKFRRPKRTKTPSDATFGSRMREGTQLSSFLPVNGMPPSREPGPNWPRRRFPNRNDRTTWWVQREVREDLHAQNRRERTSDARDRPGESVLHH